MAPEGRRPLATRRCAEITWELRATRRRRVSETSKPPSRHRRDQLLENTGARLKHEELEPEVHVRHEER